MRSAHIRIRAEVAEVRGRIAQRFLRPVGNRGEKMLQQASGIVHASTGRRSGPELKRARVANALHGLSCSGVLQYDQAHLRTPATAMQQFTQPISAPPSVVYRALLDPEWIERWRVPDGMRARVHEFEARTGGRFRVSLIYEAPGHTGKTTEHTDTYHGSFRELVPDTRVVEVMEFETADPLMQGEMVITTSLEPAEGRTMVTVVHEGLPVGVSPQDNEIGWSEALGKLARLLDDRAVAS